jgi:hypothetical protein
MNAVTQQLTATESYQRPAWMDLLFASKVEIAAAPASVRNEYIAFVDVFLADPQSYGFQHENSGDLQRDLSTDRRVAGLNQDWA